MRAQIAQNEDVDSWLDLAREVEHLFGPMVDQPDFLSALNRNIGRRSAFCIRESDGPPGAPLLGGLLFSMKPPKYKIGWLAVAERARRQGLGSCLLRHALGLITPPAEVSVITFGPNNDAGRPARRFYEAFGFRPTEMTEACAEGRRRQVFRLTISTEGENFQPSAPADAANPCP